MVARGSAPRDDSDWVDRGCAYCVFDSRHATRAGDVSDYDIG